MGIQEFYLAMSDLWDQLALTESAELQGSAPYIARREEQRLVQFLMALRDDFEGLREEIRLKSQSSNKGILPAPNPSVFVVPNQPPSSSPSRPKVGFDEFSFCKRKGHWKIQCPMLLNRAQNPSQQRSSGNQSQQRAYRPPQSNTATTVPPSPLSSFGAPPSSNPTMAALAE
ncbi:hypothetical protein Acr_00g0065880 [Actinidia rufa]|uniref:Uncharacterized protein n=1 Tax=Actinidia rufa TaxID=165716 RepID=A0A7J0DQH1_9ERIC|nr:hypothetical protein Acr_00g0065880 [Actinidia rufa]